LDELGYTDLGDSYGDMKARAERIKIDYPYLYDGEHQTVSAAYGPTTTPHVFVFDRARKLRFVGRIDDNEDPRKVTVSDTRNAIETILADKPVGVETTKTFGCSVKWSDKRRGFSKVSTNGPLNPSRSSRLTSRPPGEERHRQIPADHPGPPGRSWLNLTNCGDPSIVPQSQLYYRQSDDPSNPKIVIEFLLNSRPPVRTTTSRANKYPLIDAVGGNCRGIPFTILVRGGKIITTSEGSIDAAAMRTQIVEQIDVISAVARLSGKRQPAFVRRNGCGRRPACIRPGWADAPSSTDFGHLDNSVRNAV
jgi:hypothetical protein